MTIFHYTMSGTAAHDQTWETSGTVEVPPGDFPLLSLLASADTFMKLTNGEAEFGYPGKGCSGPYKILKFAAEAMPEPEACIAPGQSLQ